MKEISFHDILVGATLVGTFLLSYCNKHSFSIVCKPQRKEIFKGSFTTESYQQTKDGWTVANPQILSYHFITSNVPKASIDKLCTFPTQKARMELFQWSRLPQVERSFVKAAERVCSLASTSKLQESGSHC